MKKPSEMGVSFFCDYYVVTFVCTVILMGD